MTAQKPLTEPYVLYVDDDPSNRVVFEQSFGRRVPVAVVASGEEALVKVEEGGVGVVVTDQRMPGMTGNELLQRVRARHPDIVRIVITAYSDLDDILRAVNEGLVARYIVKPWERAELEEILRWALEVHARGREDSSVQVRLVQAERLVTLGSIAAALLHDLAQPVGTAETNASRLAELALAAPALVALLDRHGAELETVDAERLRDIASELGDIASDMTVGLAHMKSLLGQIRELARMPASTDPKRADPVAVLRFVEGACRGIASHARARVVIECPAELPIVHATTTELTQVLMNVLSNGIQAVGKKGGGRVAITARVQTNALLIVIDDDGVGIAEALMEKVGTPFYSTRPEGTGLGVAQCRRIVEGAGGTFRMESTDGVGTQVFVRVPWAKEKVETAEV